MPETKSAPIDIPRTKLPIKTTNESSIENSHISKFIQAREDKSSFSNHRSSSPISIANRVNIESHSFVVGSPPRNHQKHSFENAYRSQNSPIKQLPALSAKDRANQEFDKYYPREKTINITHAKKHRLIDERHRHQ